jgi:hypothetical protein
MNLEELIEQLKKYPPEMQVVVAGYEGGYNDISLIKTCAISINKNKDWYYGQHDDAEKDEQATEALVLSGENKIAGIDRVEHMLETGNTIKNNKE